MTKYSLSIIIPTYNERENINPLINKLIETCDGQTPEIIVVDAADTRDGTLECIKNEGVVKIKSKWNSRSQQMHQGAELSKSELIYFLHADTTPPVVYNRLISETIRSGKSFGMFSYRFDVDSKLLAINAKFTKKEGLFTGGGDQGLFIDRKVYFEQGGFDTNLPIMEDFEFFWRMKKRNVSYAIILKDAKVSARKYAANSYMKVNIVNMFTFIGFKIGIAPQRLKKFYSWSLKSKD